MAREPTTARQVRTLAAGGRPRRPIGEELEIEKARALQELDAIHAALDRTVSVIRSLMDDPITSPGTHVSLQYLDAFFSHENGREFLQGRMDLIRDSQDIPGVLSLLGDTRNAVLPDLREIVSYPELALAVERFPVVLRTLREQSVTPFSRLPADEQRRLEEFADMGDLTNAMDDALINRQILATTPDERRDFTLWRSFFINPVRIRQLRNRAEEGGASEVARLLLGKWERLGEDFPTITEELASHAFTAHALQTARMIVLRQDPGAIIPPIPSIGEYVRGGVFTLQVRISRDVAPALSGLIQTDPAWQAEIDRLRQTLAGFSREEFLSDAFKGVLAGSRENLRRIAQERGADATLAINAGSVQTVRIILPPPEQ